MPTIADYRNKFPSLRELDDNALIDRVAQVQGVARDDVIAHMGYKPKPAGFLRSVADLGIEAVSGVARGVKFTADAFGANNAVSQGADTVDKFARDYLSAASKADDQRVSEIMAAAQDAGVWEQVKAAAEAFTVKPAGMIANALGTSVPTIAAAMIPGVGQAGAVARLGALGAMGAAQGAGVVKGSIYEAVKAEQMKQPGMTEAEAEAIATRAQEYGGENTANIAGGGVLGVAAGTTGVQPAIVKALQRGGQQAAQAGTRGILERTLNPEGLLARTGMGALKEAPLEAAQGGQEQYASNVALQREGFDTPAFRGVAGSAALEGLAAAGPGAAFGALDKPKARADEPAKQTADELEAAIDEHEDLYADAIADPSKPGAQEVIAYHADLKQRLKTLQGEPAQPAKPGVVDVLAAPSVDDAINTAMQAVSVPTAPAVKPRKANEAAAAELAMLDPADRAEALSLMQVSERQDISGNVRRYAQNRLDELLAPVRQIPVGEAGDVVPDETINADLALMQFRTPEQIAAEGMPRIPTGEATEVDSIPTGEATELEPIPTGEASEYDPPADMVPRRKTEGRVLNLGGSQAVRNYVERMQGVNTPAARAFVQDYRAGRITDDDVMGLIVPNRRADPTPDERIAAAAAQAPKRKVQPGDILTADGMPYGSKTAANVRAVKEGLTPASVIEIPGAGWVVRPKEAKRDNQPDVSGVAGQPAADGAGRPNASVGGGMASGRVATDATGRQPGVATGVAPGGAGNAPAGVGNAPNTALTRTDEVQKGQAGDASQTRSRSSRQDDADVQDVGVRQAAVPLPNGSVVSEVRGQGNRDVPGVAGRLSGVPGGSGGAAEQGAYAGPDQQRGGVQAGQRALGNAEGAAAQSKQQQDADAGRPNSPNVAVGGGTRDSAPTAARTTGARDDAGRSSDKGSETNQPGQARGDGGVQRKADDAGRGGAGIGDQAGNNQVQDQGGRAADRGVQGAESATFASGDRVSLNGTPYTVKDSKPSAVVLTRTKPDGGTESRVVKAGTDNWKAIQPADAQQAPAPRTEATAPTAATATPASAAGTGTPGVEADGVDKFYAGLIGKKSTAQISSSGGRTLYEVQVTPDMRNKHHVNGRFPETAGFALKPKGDVTGNPGDSGYVLIDKREQARQRASNAEAPASTQAPAQAGAPVASAPAEADDYLAQLFGTPAEQAASQERLMAGIAQRKQDTERIRGAIDAEKKRAQADYDDWSNRTYKRNKTQVDLQGDGPSSQGSMSIGAINESRRRNAMDALTQELKALDKLGQAVATDSGAEQFMATMRAMLERATKIAADGNGLFKTGDEQFQYMLLDDLKVRGPGGKGNVTSNGLSKAVLAAIKPEAAPTPALTPKAQAVKEKLAAAAATHKDPGEPAEPVTPAVVREAIKTAAENEGRSRSAMKAEALQLIDEAIAKAPEKGDKKITIKVPGDGTFTVVNNVARLREFRRQVELSPGFKDKLPTYPIGKAVSGGNYGPDQLAREMLEDGEPVNAVEVLEAAGKTMMFGNGNGSSIPYTNAEPVEIAGIDDLFVGRGFGTKKGATSWWSVVHKGSGFAIGGSQGSKAEAIAEAKKLLSQPEKREKFRALVESGKSADGRAFMTQDELREQFMTEAEGKQQATFDANDASIARAAAQKAREAADAAFYKSIMGAGNEAPKKDDWTQASVVEFLKAAEKAGKVDEAQKFLDGAVRDFVRVHIADWRKDYDRRNKADDTGWKGGFQAPGGLRRIRRDVRHPDGTTYRAELDEVAGAYVTGKIEQWTSEDGRPRTVQTYSNDMDARAKADRFLDSVAELRKKQPAPSNSPELQSEAEFGAIRQAQAIAEAEREVNRVKTNYTADWRYKSRAAALRGAEADLKNVKESKPENFAGDHLAAINRAIAQGKMPSAENIRRYDIPASQLPQAAPAPAPAPAPATQAAATPDAAAARRAPEAEKIELRKRLSVLKSLQECIGK